MNLNLVKTPTGTYKILVKCNKSNEGLNHIAKLVRDANKYSSVHMGIYLIGDASFTNKVKVTSLCSGKSEHMTRKQYHSFLKGKKQIVNKKQEVMISVRNDDEWRRQEDELIRGM